MESSRVAFHRPNRINSATRLSSVKAGTATVLYQLVRSPDTIVGISDEIDEAKDRAVTEILAKRQLRSA